MMERLMLAQAQECVYEKAVTDKKSPALLARCGIVLLLLSWDLVPYTTP